jgi:serine/threonine protein kinase
LISSGQKIGNFIILDELGRGGYGTVYLAKEAHSQKRVAIKFLHPRLLRTDESKGSFLNEMINQAKLSLNPNIVSVVQSLTFVDSQGEHLGMVMEYVDGEPLDMFVQRYGLLPGFVAVPIFIQVLNGLNLAHRHNILHRDIKPGNIMVGRDGTVKIMDFGLSKAVGGTSGASESARAASLNYTAPERLKKLTVDARTDIYSIGVTMYEALTGRPPYDIEPGDWEVAIREHENGLYPGIRQFYPHHGEGLERIVRKAMSPAPSDRYQNGQELMAELLESFKATPFPERSEPIFSLIRENASEIAGIRPPIETPSPRPREIPPPPQKTIEPPKLAPQESPPRRTPDLDLLPAQPSLRKESLKALKSFYKAYKHDPEREERKILSILLGVVLIVILAFIMILAALWITGKSDYKDWEKALEISSIPSFQTYLGARPNGRYRAEAQSKIDEIRLRLEREDQARRAREESVRLANDFETNINYAKAALNQGDPKNALAYFKRAKSYRYSDNEKNLEEKILKALPIQIDDIKIFEGQDGGIDRTYSRSFKKSRSRFIFAEIAFTNNFAEIKEHNYRLSLVWQNTTTNYAPWTKGPRYALIGSWTPFVTLIDGCGWQEAGHWALGRYDVKIYIDWTLVGSTEFEIVD